MLQWAPHQIWVLFVFPQILLEAPHHTALGWGRFLPSVFLLFPLVYFRRAFSMPCFLLRVARMGPWLTLTLDVLVFILDPFNSMKHQAYFAFYLLLFGRAGSVSFLSHRKADFRWEVGHVLLCFPAKKEKKQGCYTAGSSSPGGMYALKPEVLCTVLLPLTLHWSAARFWGRSCTLHGRVGPFLPAILGYCSSTSISAVSDHHTAIALWKERSTERCDLSEAPPAEAWPPPSNTNCCRGAAALIRNASSFRGFH